MSQTFILAIVSIITTVTANLFLKNASSTLGQIKISYDTLPKLFIQIITNPWIISGLIILAIAFFNWILLLNRTALHTMYPTIVSMQIILISLFSWIFFKENFNLIQVAGIATIVVGIFVLTQS